MESYYNCIYCLRIAAKCPHRHATLEKDDTTCPFGYVSEEASDRSQDSGKKITRIPWTDERKQAMREKKQKQWEAMTDEQRKAHSDKIRKGSRKRSDRMEVAGTPSEA